MLGMWNLQVLKVRTKRMRVEEKFTADTTNYIKIFLFNVIAIYSFQILGQLRTIGFIAPRGHGDMADVNRNSNNFAVVKACFVAGFYPNVCRVDRKIGNLKSKQEKKLLPHITSVLRDKNLKSLKTNLINLPSEWIVFQEKSRVERLCLVRNNTVVSPLTIALFGGPMYIPKSNVVAMEDSDSENDDVPSMKFMLDDWIYFVLDEEIAVMIHQLRIKMNALFIKTLCNLDTKFGPNSKEWKIIDVVSSALQIEDETAGFESPKDVGARPILLPLKSGWRNNNKNQRGNVMGHGQNGRPNLRTSQHPNQWQTAAGHQVTNNFNSSHNNQQKSIMYRRNNNGSRNGFSSSNAFNDFELFMASFKCQVMLKPRVRYFVFHGNSKDHILEAYKPFRKWQYSGYSLRQFKSIKQVSLKIFC